jgi:hypothetical protein
MSKLQKSYPRQSKVRRKVDVVQRALRLVLLVLEILRQIHELFF